jgi:hypothetical protein
MVVGSHHDFLPCFQAISDRKAAFSQGTEEAKATFPPVSPEEDEA